MTEEACPLLIFHLGNIAVSPNSAASRCSCIYTSSDVVIVECVGCLPIPRLGSMNTPRGRLRSRNWNAADTRGGHKLHSITETEVL